MMNLLRFIKILKKLMLIKILIQMAGKVANKLI